MATEEMKQRFIARELKHLADWIAKAHAGEIEDFPDFGVLFGETNLNCSLFGSLPTPEMGDRDWRLSLWRAVMDDDTLNTTNEVPAAIVEAVIRYVSMARNRGAYAHARDMLDGISAGPYLVSWYEARRRALKAGEVNEGVPFGPEEK